MTPRQARQAPSYSMQGLRLLYTHKVVSAIVLIGPRDALPALRKQLATETEVQTFTDQQVREAVEFIATARPAVVALDEQFAGSARGEALMGRIADDAALSSCDVRVLARNPGAAVAPSSPESPRTNG